MDTEINIFDKANEVLQNTSGIKQKQELAEEAWQFGSKLKQEIESESKKRIPDYIKMRQAYDTVMNANPEELAAMDNEALQKAMEHEILTGKAEAENQALFAAEFKKKTAQALFDQENKIYTALSLANKFDEMYANGENPGKIREVFNSLDPEVQRHVAKIKAFKKQNGTTQKQNIQKTIEDVAKTRKQLANSDDITKIAQNILSSIQ